jgi:hypothetical protein
MATQIATPQYNAKDVLAAMRGVTFIGLDIETVVKLKGGKKNPMQGRVTKRVTGSTVLVAQNKTTNTYQNMVHNRLTNQYLDEALDKANTAKASLVDILPANELDELAQKIESALAAGNDERREAAEEAFTVSARKWGERIPNSPFIQHTKADDVHANYYLDTIWLRAGEVAFFLDGNPIDEDKIEGYEKPAVKEGANVQGGLKAENQVIVRSIGLDSILRIKTGGTDYLGQFYYA